jgi:hypothetical protein
MNFAINIFFAPNQSLAMALIQSNLNGDASNNDFLKSLPAVEVFPY